MELQSLLLTELSQDCFHMISSSTATRAMEWPHTFEHTRTRSSRWSRGWGQGAESRCFVFPSISPSLGYAPPASWAASGGREQSLIVNAQQDSGKAEINSPWIYMDLSGCWWLVLFQRCLCCLLLLLLADFIPAYGGWRHDTKRTFYTRIKVGIWQFLSESSEQRICETRFMTYFIWDTSVSSLHFCLNEKGNEGSLRNKDCQ